MKLCCEKIVSRMTSKGEKGVSILARNTDIHKGFVMQFRSFSPSELTDLTKTSSAEEKSAWSKMCDEIGFQITISSACNVVLMHCPYCGASFKDVIEKDAPGFDLLVSTDRKFLEEYNPLG